MVKGRFHLFSQIVIGNLFLRLMDYSAYLDIDTVVFLGLLSYRIV